jgi:hypothetical protein
MPKSVRTGIGTWLFTASLVAAAGLILNPRFVDDLRTGLILYLGLPLAGGALLGILLGRPLRRLAEIGSNEAPVRAYELLWASVVGFATFFTSLAVLPSYLSLLSDSETFRYGGALVLACGLAWLGAHTIRYVANRFRVWIWPFLVALPIAAVVLGGTGWGRGRAPGSRIAVLAFPGLSWRVAEEMIERGQMPNLARLREHGAWGDVRTPRPILGPAVWTSIASGKTPEEHGILGFHAASGDVRSARIWDILQDRGWSVGLYGWPVTWPPPDVDGFVVPAVSDVGTETRPRELNFIRELAMSEKTRQPRTWGRYLRYGFLAVRHGVRLSTLLEATGDVVTEPFRGRELDAAHLFAKRKLRAKLNADYFIEQRRRHPVDFAAFYTNIVHVAQTYFWRYHEPASFEGVRPDEIARYGDSVHDAYRIVDGFIGAILADTAENDLVVVVSDHGAVAASDESRHSLTLRIEPMLVQMRLKDAVEATNLGARTYLRMLSGHEADRERVRRLFETARFASSDERAFLARVDEWGNVVVTVSPSAAERGDDVLLFQGGRCPVREIVRAVKMQESAQPAETGALVLAGRGVEPGRRFEGAHLLDLVPTLLVLEGLDLAADLPGDVIADALDPSLRDRIPGVVATYDRPRGPVAPN